MICILEFLSIHTSSGVRGSYSAAPKVKLAARNIFMQGIDGIIPNIED